MSPRAGRRARPSAVVFSETEPLRLAWWLLVALAIPRVARILYPAVWVEDDLLLQCSLAVSKGLRPYLDFADAQMPLLEWIGGVYIRLAGASHVAMELLNGAAIYATSILIVLVGRRAAGARAAAAASLLYACHSLVFRYHVWAREFFVSALVLGAMLILLREPRSERSRILIVSTLLCAACAIKLTSGIAAIAVMAYVALPMRAPGRAMALAATFVVFFSTFVAFCYWRYGEPFIFQAFLFHLLKGADPTGAGPAYILSLLDVLGPLGVLGAWHLSRRTGWNHALGLASAVLVLYLLFFGLLSPTAWGHNYLEVWPFVCLLAGAGVAWLVDAWHTSWLRVGAGVASTAACLLWFTPLNNESALRGSVYGFGFVARRELSDLAGALRDATTNDDEVIAPSFIAFEAGRLQAIRFPENAGVMQAGDELRRSVGFREARARLGTKSFFDLINETSDIWTRDVVHAIAPDGRVHAFVPDSPIQLLPLVNASPTALSDRGFHPSLQTEHFTLWVRPSHPSARQRTTNVSPGGV